MKRIFNEQKIVNNDHASINAWFPVEERESNLYFPSLIILNRRYGDRYTDDGDHFVETFYFTCDEQSECAVIRKAIEYLDKEAERILQDIKVSITE
jgi:hypothetical protein